MEVLSLAYELSLISYYAGLALYASPLPMSVKRFGVRMAYHGVVSALLTLLYASIIYIIESLMITLGLSWDELAKFYDKLSLTSASYYAAATGLTLFASKASSLGVVKGALLSLIKSSVRSVARSLFRASMLLGVSEAAVRVVASLVYQYWQLLLALGILLYAIPAGIGRRAGASLIASAIILYLALPLLPQWASLWVSSVARENIVVGVYAGGGSGKGYIVWGVVDDVLDLATSDALHVVFWRGGVPLVAESHGTFTLLYPLTRGYYLVSVYLGRYEVGRVLVNIPGNCSNENPPVPSIIDLLILLFESIGYSKIEMCPLHIRLTNVLVPSYNLAAYWDPGLRFDYVETSSDGNEFNLTLVGRGWVHICACCSCKKLIVDINGSASKPSFHRDDGIICADAYANGAVSIHAKAVECKAGFDRVGPSYSPYQPLLTLILHDIPLGAYMVALAYSGAIWSFLALAALAIYGFGRVLGENPALVLRVRY